MFWMYKHFHDVERDNICVADKFNSTANTTKIIHHCSACLPAHILQRLHWFTCIKCCL